MQYTEQNHHRVVNVRENIILKKLHLFQREGKDDAITNSNVISQEVHRWAEIQPTIQFILKCSVWTLKGKKCIIKQNVVLRKSDKFETVPDYSFHQIMFKRALHILWYSLLTYIPFYNLIKPLASGTVLLLSYSCYSYNVALTFYPSSETSFQASLWAPSYFTIPEANFLYITYSCKSIWDALKWWCWNNPADGRFFHHVMEIGLLVSIRFLKISVLGLLS